MAGFEDDIGADIAAAIETPAPASQASSPASDAVLPSEPAPDKTVASASEGERPRGPDGKFVATEKPDAADKKSVAPAETATGAQAQAPVETTQDAPIAAPAHWMGSGKVDWNKLPRNVQQALTADYANLSKPQAEYQQLRTAIGEDRLQALAADYGSIPQAFQSLATIRDMANKNPTGFVQWFAQSRGIDLRSLVQSSPQGSEQQPTDNSNPLQQEVLQLRNQLQQLVQQQQTQAQTTVLSEIDAFARDPNHPYFNDVREHMGALMKAGKAATLQEAYDMATWAVPSVRQSLLEKQTQQAMQANAQKIQAAKQAAGSITGSPAGAIIAKDEPDTDLESLIRKQVSALA